MIKFDNWNYDKAKEHVINHSLVDLAKQANENPGLVDKVMTLFFERISSSDSNEKVPESLILKALNITFEKSSFKGLVEYVEHLSNDPLIEAGTISIHEKNDKGCSYLHLVAMLGRVDVIRALLKLGANINEIDVNRNTPLHKSVGCRQKESVTALLTSGARQIQNIKGNTPLMLAASYGFTELFQPLIDHGSNINEKDPNGFTALKYALNSNQKESIRSLIEKNADIESEDSNGNTVLHFAATKGDVETLELLIAKKAKYGINKRGMTALHYAAAEGRLACCDLLFKYKSSLEVKDQAGWTPLHYAAANGRIEVISHLLGKGALIQSEDLTGRTPLHLTFSYGYLKAALHLIKLGSSPFALDIFKKSPLDHCKTDIKAEFRKAASLKKAPFKNLSVEISNPNTFFTEDVIKALEKLTH